MALNRQWSYPAGVGSVTTNDMVTKTVHELGTPGFILGADQIQVPTLITAPPSTASVFAPASYTAQTASVATVVQNTLGYDAMFVGYFAVSSASVATFQVGVGPSVPVTMSTVATSVTNTTASTTHIWSFPAYVPTSYYYSFQASQANGASVGAASFTVVANPV